MYVVEYKIPEDVELTCWSKYTGSDKECPKLWTFEGEYVVINRENLPHEDFAIIIIDIPKEEQMKYLELNITTEGTYNKIEFIEKYFDKSGNIVTGSGGTFDIYGENSFTLSVRLRDTTFKVLIYLKDGLSLNEKIKVHRTIKLYLEKEVPKSMDINSILITGGVFATGMVVGYLLKEIFG